MSATPASGMCVQGEPFALRVLDDSMAPEFPAGCIVVVDPTGVACDGAFVVAVHADALLLRRLVLDGGRPLLRALASDVPDLEPAGGLAALCGVVVQRAGRRRGQHKRYDAQA